MCEYKHQNVLKVPKGKVSFSRMTHLYLCTYRIKYIIFWDLMHIIVGVAAEGGTILTHLLLSIMKKWITIICKVTNNISTICSCGYWKYQINVVLKYST